MVNVVIEKYSFFTYFSVVSRYSATVQTFISTTYTYTVLFEAGFKKMKGITIQKGEGGKVGS